MWTTYATLGLATILSLRGAKTAVASEADALQAMVLSVVMLVLVPYRWTRSQVVTRQNALHMLGWTWSTRLVPLGMAAGTLLFAAFSTAEPRGGAFPWAVAALYGVVAAFCEELFFRGHLQKRIGAWQIPAFAVLHSTGSLGGTLVPLLAGIVLTLLARQGLTASVSAHAAFNILAVLQAA